MLVMSDGAKETTLPSPTDSDPLEKEMREIYGKKYDRLAKIPSETEKQEFIDEEIADTWNIADIIHNAEKQKLLDPLTGLLNRRGLDLLIKTVYKNAQQFPDTEIYAYMVDLDHFREVNNNYGHQTGDEALKALGGAVRAATDLAVRYGGEEILIITNSKVPTFDNQHTQRMDPNVFINKLRYRISKNVANNTEIKTQGVSAGFAKLEKDPSTGQFIPPEELIRRADVALYHSKTHGRGRATAYQPGMNMPQNGK